MLKLARSLVLALALVGLGAAVHAATTNAGTQTVTRGACTLYPDNSLDCLVPYTNTATGRLTSMRRIKIPAVQAQPIVDDGSPPVTLAASVPSALFTQIQGLGSQIDTTLANAAAAGKLDL